MKSSKQLYRRVTPALCMIIMSALTSQVQAQNFLRRFEFGGALGTTIYQGDLTPNPLGAYRSLKLSSALYVNRIINNQLAVRLQYTAGRIALDESKYTAPEWRQQRNFMMNTRIRELAVLGIWDIRGAQLTRPVRQLQPYLIGGAGIASLTVQRDWSRLNAEYFGSSSSLLEGLASDTSTALPRSVFTLPVGAGLRYGISRRIGLTAEAQYRLSFTDYLDGFKAAGNPEKLDHFYGITVGLVIRLGNLDVMPCPSSASRRSR